MSRRTGSFLSAFAVLLFLFPIGSFAQTVYVANEGDNTVSVVDTTANPPTVTATISVGRSPRFIKVSPDGTKVYVGNISDDTISVIDTTNLTARPKSVSTGGDFVGMVLTPDGKKLFIAHPDDTISVIDAQAITPITTFRLYNTTPTYHPPIQYITVSPDSATVYVSETGIDGSAGYNGFIWTINSSAYTSFGPIPIGGGGLSISPDGMKFYSYDISNNVYIDSVAVVSNNQDGHHIGTLPRSARPPFVFVPDGTKAYIFGSAGLELISTTTGAIISSLKVGSGSSNDNIAISSDGSKVCIPNTIDNTISLIDSSATPPVVTDLAISVGKMPEGTAFGPPNNLRLNIPQLTTDSNGGRHLVQDVYVQGTGSPVIISGHWVDNGKAGAKISTVSKVTLTSGKWYDFSNFIEPGSTDNLISGNHAIQFVLETPYSATTSIEDIAITRLIPSQTVWSKYGISNGDLRSLTPDGECEGFAQTARANYLGIVDSTPKAPLLPPKNSSIKQFDDYLHYYSQMGNQHFYKTDEIRVITALTNPNNAQSFVITLYNEAFKIRQSLTNGIPCVIDCYPYITSNTGFGHSVLGTASIYSQNVYDDKRSVAYNTMQIFSIYDPNDPSYGNNNLLEAFNTDNNDATIKFVPSTSAYNKYVMWVANTYSGQGTN